ncbi:MAG: M23 family metallopeptidase [Acidimicrobiia bacterium]|nr:M23 family metallopeptidase [Acidimicrobiia bacterium]
MSDTSHPSSALPPARGPSRPPITRRRRLRSRPAALVAGLVMVGLSGLPAAGQQPDPAPSDDPLIGQLEEVTSAEGAALAELARIDSQIVGLDSSITTAGVQVNDAQLRVATAEAALAVAAEAEVAAAILAAEQDRLVARVVNLYVAGPGAVDPDQLALAADTPTEALTIRTYGEAVVERTQDVVDQYEVAERAAEASIAAADVARAAVAAERDAVQAELDRLGGLRDEADLVRARQQEVAADLAARRAALESEILAQDVEADAIGALLAARQGAVELALPLTWTWPVPSAARLGSPFGNRLHPVLGYVRLHRGSDIGCATGADIVATAPGEVIIAGTRGGYGETVVIDHGGKVATLMAHNSAVSVAVGDLVEAGQVVARCGSTGLSTGPHSHFEVRIEGNPVDPAQVLTPPG